MRLTLLAEEQGGASRARSGLDEGDPLPPDDRLVPALVPSHGIEALFRAQAPRLLRFFSRRAPSHEAHDLVQEPFERLARRDIGSAAIDRLEAYLSRVAGNLLRDRAKFAIRRAAAFHVPLDDVSIPGSDPHPHEQLEARDMINRLELAIQRLNPRTREIFMACRLDGYTYAEVAERVGMSVRGVRKRMSRAIAEINRAIGEE